jgi:hypothetical protein
MDGGNHAKLAFTHCSLLAANSTDEDLDSGWPMMRVTVDVDVATKACSSFLNSHNFRSLDRVWRWYLGVSALLPFVGVYLLFQGIASEPQW